ncbi:MAG: DUF4097 family beta strand repeat protein [Acidobacteria bacterium]|nr:DUF4097 family beta strand repeat protein [Acidobacteriota bacterium]
MRGLLLALSALIFLASCSVVAQAEARPFEMSFVVPSTVVFEAETLAGRITIRSGVADRARIRGQVKRRPSLGGFNLSESELRRLQEHPPVRLDGSTIRLERIADERTWKGAAIDYEIELPRTAQVRIRTESGRVFVEHILSGVSATTRSSAIEFRDVSGPVTARTGSGEIVLRLRGPGDVVVSTKSGDVRIEGAESALEVRTQSSRIAIDGSPGGTWSVESDPGSITVRVRGTTAFSVDAASRSGQVSSDLPVVGTTGGKHRIEGTVRGGGPTIRTRTRSSSITLH